MWCMRRIFALYDEQAGGLKAYSLRGADRSGWFKRMNATFSKGKAHPACA
jgi:hypothetical protein